MKIAIFSQDINQDVDNVLQSILVHEEASNCNFFIHDNLRIVKSIQIISLCLKNTRI